MAEIAPGLRVEGVGTSGAGEAVAPNVPFILLDLGLPDVVGTQAELVRRFAVLGGRVVVHSSWIDHLSTPQIDELILAGASGYVRKGDPADLRRDLRRELEQVFPLPSVKPKPATRPAVESLPDRWEARLRELNRRMDEAVATRPRRESKRGRGTNDERA